MGGSSIGSLAYCLRLRPVHAVSCSLCVCSLCAYSGRACVCSPYSCKRGVSLYRARADAVHDPLVRMLGRGRGRAWVSCTPWPCVLAMVVLAASALVITMFVHAMTVPVVAMRMIVLVSQVRLFVPETLWTINTPRSPWRSRSRPINTHLDLPEVSSPVIAHALYQVKLLTPLITTSAMPLARASFPKTPADAASKSQLGVRDLKLSVSQRYSSRSGPSFSLAGLKNRTVKRASQRVSIPPLVGNISI